DAWADARFATDPNVAGKTVRAPNGVVLDGKDYWSAGKATFDPAKITAPVLLVVGEWDQDTLPYMAQTLFPLMVNAKWRRLTMLSEATQHPNGEESDAAIPDSATIPRGGSAAARSQVLDHAADGWRPCEGATSSRA